MPHKPRELSESGIYHIVLRAVNQQQIFEDSQDCSFFLSLLSNYIEKYDIHLYAYCLMSNHIHLCMEFADNNLSQVMQNFISRFVFWYNKKYQRSGHLFQARFWSTPITSDEQLAATILYIHRNPTKANVCRYDTEYRWSSARAYYGGNDPIVSVDRIVQIFHSTEGMLHYFATSNIDYDACQFDPGKEKTHSLIDEAAKIRFHEITGCKSPSDFQTLPKKNRNRLIIQLNDAHLSHSQIARLGGISPSTVFRVIRSYKNE